VEIVLHKVPLLMLANWNGKETSDSGTENYMKAWHDCRSKMFSSDSGKLSETNKCKTSVCGQLGPKRERADM
jgi:hypothetical protein